ncbi:MAG: ABC transporter permease [Acidobacteriota bacterium]|jgi:predicted permease
MRSPAELLFRALLVAYPADVRRRDGVEMRRTFEERRAAIRDRNGRAGVLTHYGREFAGMIAAAFALRRSSSGPTRRPSSPFRKGFAHTMESLLQDVRQALRTMRRQKVLTAAALVTLALGIGANTAIFSVVYGVLMRPLPYPDPGGLVRVSEEHPGANAPIPGALLSDVTLRLWQPSMKALEGIAAWSSNTYTVGTQDPERLRGAAASPVLFDLLRQRPALGRFFTDEEAVEGADDVVVIGYGFWRERYGADPDVLGQRLVIDDRPHTIIGVAPEGLAFPVPETVLWKPYVMSTEPLDAENPSMGVFGAVGRVADGYSAEQAATEGTAAARSIPRPFIADLLFGKGDPVEVRVQPLVEEMTAEVRPALRVLSVGVGLVLLIACANVANLLLSHGMARQRELGVRAALGASRGRIIRLLLTEGLLIAAAGGIAGWLLALWLLRLLPVLAPADFPRLDAVHLDGGALLFAVGVSILSGLGSGLIPALRGAGAGVSPTLHDGDARSTGTQGKRLRAGLLVAEAAFAVILVVAASLLVRSFVSMTRVDSGYRPDNVLMGQIFLSGADQEAAQANNLVSTLLRRLESRSDVVAAGAANMAPFGGAVSISGFHLPLTDPEAEPVAVRATTWKVTPDYADALGLRVVEGRFLTPDDVTSGTQAMVVNEEFAHLFLNDGEPVVGRSYLGLIGDDDLTTEIVGVVANVLMSGPTRDPQPEIYLAAGGHGRNFDRWVFVFVRTTGDPQALAPELRALVRDIAPTAALDGVGTLAGRLSTSLAQPRFAAAVLGSFALLALVLAATGLYGVLSYSVSQRRREMGVRKALGARGSELVRLVLWQGLSVVSIGLLLGLAGAAATTRLMQSLLFGIEPLDLVAFGVAPLILLLVAVIACLVPARRAAAADPAVAFRAE